MESPFKSKLIKAYDYRDVDLSGFFTPFTVDEEALKEELLTFRKKHARLKAVEVVNEGDMVTLSCQSDKPKFNREAVTVNVGKGLYSRELERQLVGIAVGDQAEINADGTAVTVVIKDIKRSVLPPLTDELVVSVSPELGSAAALRQMFIQEQMEEHITAFAEEAAKYIEDQVAAKSEYAIDEEERLAAMADGERMIREQWQYNGIDVDALSDDEAREMFGGTVRECLDYFASLLVKEVLLSLIGYDILTGEGKAFTREEYETTLKENAEMARIPREELAKQFTFPVFVRQICSEYYDDMLKQYAYERIKEAIQ